MRLIITRHGQTEWNTTRRMQGSCDSPLTEQGVRQADQLRARLRLLDVDCACVSPLQRARQTAAKILCDRDVDVRIDARLQEASLGLFEGITMDEARQRYPEQADNFQKHPERFAPIGGETFDQVRARVAGFLHDMTRERGCVLVVTHALVMRVMRVVLLDLPLSSLMETATPPCCYGEAIWRDGWQLLSFGDNQHLSEEFGDDRWYYGGAEPSHSLPAGSLVTPFPSVARALAAGPASICASLSGVITHDGSVAGWLHRVASVSVGELTSYSHPQLGTGKTWVTRKPYRIEPIEQQPGHAGRAVSSTKAPADWLS